jgi:transcription antitermination factor NusG
VEVGRAFEPGQEVEITQGPFRDLKALVTRLITARERVELLIEWMGCTLRAEAGVTDLGEVQDAVKKFNDRYSP